MRAIDVVIQSEHGIISLALLRNLKTKVCIFKSILIINSDLEYLNEKHCHQCVIIIVSLVILQRIFALKKSH